MAEVDKGMLRHLGPTLGSAPDDASRQTACAAYVIAAISGGFGDAFDQLMAEYLAVARTDNGKDA